jgi:hypothetical protein
MCSAVSAGFCGFGATRPEHLILPPSRHAKRRFLAIGFFDIDDAVAEKARRDRWGAFGS